MNNFEKQDIFSYKKNTT